MIQSGTKTMIRLIILAFVLGGCAKERPIKYVLNNGRRLPKTSFQGTFLFQKTITNIKYAGKSTQEIPTGSYENSNKLIQFEIKENTLDIVAIDPLFKEERAALKSSLLASFGVKHVDILRKQNSEGQDTHEEEETETRRPWRERALMVIDPTKDSQDSFSSQSRYANTPDHIDLDPNSGAINMDVTYQLQDETQISLRYSFLPYSASTTYIPKHYPDKLALRFGFFHTTTLQFDQYGRILESQAKKNTVMNRWNTEKTIVYYLSKDFPDHLKSAAFQVFEQWNQVFQSAIGKKPLELRENTGQELGDLRYSMIHYDPTVDASHGILGYGPSYTHPRTGEIVKADVILYGGVLKSSIARERTWSSILSSDSTSRVTAPSTISPQRAPVEPLSPVKFVGNPQVLKTRLQSVNTEYVALLSKPLSPLKNLAVLKQRLLNEHRNSMTRLTEDVLTQIHNGISTSKLSDEELEIAIFTPLLTHELGHNLGLRHNFMGSADRAHFSKNAKSSSVMDYGFLTSEEPSAPGLYDAAAIEVAYGKSEAKVEQLFQENFYYCTDESVMSSAHGLCHQFDSGSTLTEIIQSQFNRYMASWAFNNLRNDRVYFNMPGSINQYVNRIQMYLIPFRLIYDNADAILRANQDKSLENLWRLLQQRIEADKNSDPKNIEVIKISKGVKLKEASGGISLSQEFLEVNIDTSKIAALVKEAQQAKTLAYQALMTVILNTNRPDYNLANGITQDLEIRGVILDKMVALQLAGFQTPDPVESNSSISLFSSSEGGEFKKFLVTLLSDTAISETNASDSTVFQISPSDANLKEIALEIISSELSVSGTDVSARKLLQVSQIALDKNSSLLLSEQTFREKARKLYQAFFKPGLSEDERTQLTAQLELNQIERNKASTIAATPAFLEGGIYFVAPVALPELGLESAAGHLIRDNLNVLEDMMSAIKTLITENKAFIETESQKPIAERDEKKLVEAIGAIEMYQQTSQSITQLAENERLFLEKFYKISNQR